MYEVLQIINKIKKIHDCEYVDITGDFADTIFQYHYCFYFAKLLKMFYPNGEYFMKNDGSHVMLKIGPYLFDSLGCLFDNNEDFHSLNEEDWHLIEIQMKPKSHIQRQKLENIIDEIYKKISEEHLVDSNTTNRKK